MHWPGAVVATSTKPDLFGLTSGLRARRGPVHVFNPQRRGGVSSTFRWNPLQGCEEPAVAIRRASAFTEAVDQSGVEKGDWFGERAGAYLRALFCAAALGGHDMLTVARWASGMEITAAQEILRRHGREEWVRELDQLHGQARRTIESIQMTMAAALGFLADPGLQECVLPGPGEIDLPGFLTGGGTLYLIARKQGKTAPLGPLFAAIASEVQYQAVLLGSMQPGGRLDPPLLMALDEATAICPVPVPSWLSDAGGQGVSLIVVCHSEAQLRTSWGADGAQVVMDTCGTVAWFAGIKDTRHAGDRLQALRRDVLPPARPGARDTAPGPDTGDDLPASAQVRADPARRPVARHRPCPDRLARPGLSAGPDPRPGRGAGAGAGPAGARRAAPGRSRRSTGGRRRTARQQRQDPQTRSPGPCRRGGCPGTRRRTGNGANGSGARRSGGHDAH